MKNLAYAIRPLALDMLSTIVFAVLIAVTHNVYVSTAAAIAMGVVQVVWQKARRQPVAGMQWASLGLVTVMGAASLLTGDPRFVMIKPTVIYLTVGAVMMRRGWMARYMPPSAKDYLPPSLIVAWGYVWAALMFGTAAANLVIALTLGVKAWTVFLAFFPLASKLGLFAVHYLTFRFIAIRNQRAQLAAATGETPIAAAA